jgi:hypothetical protein
MDFLNDSDFANKKDLNELDAMALEKNTGKKFGTLLKCGIVDGIRYLLTDKGFSIWIPQYIYYKYDIQVNRYLSTIDSNNNMWIADKNYVFVKIDITADDLNGDDKKYMNTNLDVRSDKGY